MIGSDTGPGRVPCRDLPKIPIRCSRFPPNRARLCRLSLRSRNPTRCCDRRCAAAAASAGGRPADRAGRSTRARARGFEEAGLDPEVRSGDISPRTGRHQEADEPARRDTAARTALGNAHGRRGRGHRDRPESRHFHVDVSDGRRDETIAAPAPVSTQGSWRISAAPQFEAPTVSESRRDSQAAQTVSTAVSQRTKGTQRT